MNGTRRERELVSNRHERLDCLTCGDEAVAARVHAVEGLAAEVVIGGNVERVAIDLVPDVRPGELLLCHAGIALERLEESA